MDEPVIHLSTSFLKDGEVRINRLKLKRFHDGNLFVNIKKGPRAINHFNLSFKIYLISNNTPAQNQTPPPTTSIAANSISIPHKNAKPISITTDITPLIVIIHIIGSDIAFNS